MVPLEAWKSLLLLLIPLIILFISSPFHPVSALTATDLIPIINRTDILFSPNITLYYDPPDRTVAPTALGIYVWSNIPTVRIFYDLSGQSPNITVTPATAAEPYIQMDTPFKYPRNRTLVLIGVLTDKDGIMYKSKEIRVRYFVEASARPYSYAYMIPGVESGGYFLQVSLEVAASARAQAAGAQEFADFFSDLGYGTYRSQIQALHLTSIDPDLNGFEGGFTYNVSHAGPYYGVLIPYYNGRDFYGKVVRVNLWEMKNATTCVKSYRIEKRVNGVSKFSGTAASAASACVYIMDLQSLDVRARGFRRGFLGYPFGYLSPGTDQVLVKLDLLNFDLAHTRLIDLAEINPTYGGYSGGFVDGLWACYTPYRTYAGEVGGIRSLAAVDSFNLHPYYNSILMCVHNNAWNPNLNAGQKATYFREIDFSLIELDLRGFSDSIRVGRYAYLSPLTSGENVYSSKMIRISLGNTDIGTAIDTANANNNIRQIVSVLDLSQVTPNLGGFSGLFTAGHYLFLVPFRNSYTPANGQRGHGFVVRLNMNKFSEYGVEYVDVSSTTRNQIPSFFDTNLRGYSYGMASGQYCLLVPFFNANFNGKMARFYNLKEMTSDLQELDLTVDRARPRTYKGYRGGFVSIWNGVDNPNPS